MSKYIKIEDKNLKIQFVLKNNLQYFSINK